MLLSQLMKRYLKAKYWQFREWVSTHIYCNHPEWAIASVTGEGDGCQLCHKWI
jgi:hypothetical protein